MYVNLSEKEFRDNLVGWYNMSRDRFARVMYDQYVNSNPDFHHHYIDEKYRKFKENPLEHVLTLDSANFKRFMEYILDDGVD